MWLWSFFFSLMKIISWNVNSVTARITNILDYIKQSSPDIMLLQEIKTQDISFPYEDFQNIGYNSYVFGQKSYNGVAIISKGKLKNIKMNSMYLPTRITKEQNLKNRKHFTLLSSFRTLESKKGGIRPRTEA